MNCEGALASRASVCLVFRNCVPHSFSQYLAPEPEANLLMSPFDLKGLMLGLTNDLKVIQEGPLQILSNTPTLLEPLT